MIPAYNESGRVAASLHVASQWVATKPGGWDWEVILVDDGSTDGTAEVARRAAEESGLPLEILVHPRNRGKGAALRTGVLGSRGDPVLVCDTDLSTPLTEWVKLAERLPTHPVAIGSRAMDLALVRRPQPYYRRLLGRTGNLLVRMFAVRGIADTQCGFKLFRGDIARSLFRDARVAGFAYDMEILHLAQKRGIPIAEVPVLWFNSPDSRVSVLRHTLPTLRDLLKIRWMHRREAR
ncbi:MAG: dolichyl-phosphate beta-glucosyltransferase [Acidobacteriota bacterium]